MGDTTWVLSPLTIRMAGYDGNCVDKVVHRQCLKNVLALLDSNCVQYINFGIKYIIHNFYYIAI